VPATGSLDGDTLFVRRGVRIPLSELTFRATGSGGPGGQHANTANTRVEVVYDVAGSDALGPRQRARVIERLGPLVRVVASDSRSQARNRLIALERLASRVDHALREERPRIPTSTSKAAKARRVEEKRHRGDVKRTRQPPPAED
jgi:ribosome-associated protein